MEQFETNLKEALRNLQIADHMAYLTYPLINEKRILLKIFDEIFKTVTNCVSAVINYEAMLKRVSVSEDRFVNLENFVRKFSGEFDLNERQINLLLDIYEINKQHEDSAIEFVRKDKMVIMSDSLGLRTLDIGKIKEFLIFSKEFLMKINLKLNV